MTDARLTARIRELQERLERLRPEYERAKLQHAQSGPAREAAWLTLHALLSDFHAGDPGDKAIYLLGRAAQVLADADAAGAVIAEHDELRERMRKLEALLPQKEPGV